MIIRLSIVLLTGFIASATAFGAGSMTNARLGTILIRSLECFFIFGILSAIIIFAVDNLGLGSNIKDKLLVLLSEVEAEKEQSEIDSDTDDGEDGTSGEEKKSVVKISFEGDSGNAEDGNLSNESMDFEDSGETNASANTGSFVPFEAGELRRVSTK